MCSIFGYIARAGQKPDLTILKQIVQGNIHRGPHAYGLAWIDQDNRLHAYKSKGDMTNVNILHIVRQAKMLIGHLRFATHGNPANNSNNHPHPADGGWMVHNGVVSNHQSLIKRHRLPMSSECDSEVICRLMEYEDGSRLQRSANSVDLTTGYCATLGLWNRPNCFIATRRGNPLHYCTHHSGLYIASLDAGLPGYVHEFPDNQACRIFLKDKQFQSREIGLSTTTAPRQYHSSSYRGG